MTIKQLSVFLENETGRINDVTRLLGEAGINLSAFSMAENVDFGILRVVVSEPERAQKILKEQGFAVTLTDVICLSCPNVPGALSKALDYLSQEHVVIEYMYAFANGERALVVIRPDNIVLCIEVLKKHSLDLMAAGELYQL